MIPARATLTDFTNLGVAAARVANVATPKQQAELDAASDLVDGYLSRQVDLPLDQPYPRDIIKAECIIAAASLLDNIGWNPNAPADKSIMDKRQWYMDTWLPGVSKGEIGPNFSGINPEIDGPSGPEVITSTSRGYSERGMSIGSHPCASSGAFSDD